MTVTPAAASALSAPRRPVARGGWVALVDDGALAAHESVALTLRSHP